MFKDLFEKRKKEEPTTEEIIQSMEFNIKQKQKMIDKLVDEISKKDKIIEELEREIETISSGVMGC
jgi:predicted RNase H-like nuclease (RuvC/YqgF family)